MNPKIEKLIKQFAKLPRVGGRGGRRIVLALLQDKTGRAQILAQMLADASATIRPCETCGCLTDGGLCEFCRDAARANGQICIVRDLADVWVIEKAGVFRGRYHVVGGLISGASGTLPEDLNIRGLARRLADEKITEIIFALPNTVEGKTTQHYIVNIMGAVPEIRVTELASGVPLGGDLDYIDDGTLSLAFGRRDAI